jgi:glycosyltransferase involved in cell wall biosynthesis
MSKKKLKIALVCDLLTQLGGGEKVLIELLKIFPGAPIYTLIYNPQRCGQIFGKYDIRTSWLQRLPGAIKHYKKLLFFYPSALKSFDLSQYDLIISVTSALAKGIRTHKDQIHICYCHTPTRYLWIDKKRYVRTVVPKILQPLVNRLLPILRRWDYQTSQRVDYFIANSHEVQKRIKKYYHRDSKVIYPSVETKLFSLKKQKQDFYLMTGRLVPYKRYDIVIRAFNQLADKKLVIAGQGPDRQRLEKLAKGDKITFLGRVSDKRLVALYQNAKAYLFPALEDFGITPLEAMCSGTPVIAFGKGGALETVTPGISGIFFDEQNPRAVIKALNKFEKMKFTPTRIRKTVLKFSQKRFRMEMRQFISNRLG